MARERVQRAAAIEPVKGPWALPDGWRWVQLGSLGEFWNGAAFKPSDWGEEGTPIIRIQNLNDPARAMNRTTRVVDDRLLIRAGDLLVSWSASLDAYVWNREDAWLNQHIFKVVPHAKIVYHRYMLFLLKNEIENLKKTEHLHGSTMMHINRGPFLAHLVPLPPMNTQELVVARIDELFAELDDGEAALERARGDLGTWRKTLLKAAVTGELTADWRAANPPTETGADLLARILAERRTRWLAEPRNRGKRYIEPEGLETPVQVTPDGWALTGAGPLLTWASGKFLPDRLMSGAAIPVYGGNGIAGHHHEWLVDRPTLVVGRVGFYCGNAYVTAGPAWITDNAIYASTIDPSVDPRFIRIVFEQANLRVRAQGGAQPFVSQGLLNSVAIPLPGLSEQEQIVAQVDSLMNEAVALTEASSVLGEGSATLRQSILAAAFRGDLVA